MFAVDLLNWLAVSIVTSNPDDKFPKRRAGITNTSSNFLTQIWTPEILPYALWVMLHGTIRNDDF